jgi:hypothetical protein
LVLAVLQSLRLVRVTTGIILSLVQSHQQAAAVAVTQQTILQAQLLPVLAVVAAAVVAHFQHQLVLVVLALHHQCKALTVAHQYLIYSLVVVVVLARQVTLMVQWRAVTAYRLHSVRQPITAAVAAVQKTLLVVVLAVTVAVVQVQAQATQHQTQL